MKTLYYIGIGRYYGIKSHNGPDAYKIARNRLDQLSGIEYVKSIAYWDDDSDKEGTTHTWDLIFDCKNPSSLKILKDEYEVYLEPPTIGAHA